ncbi:GDP-Man:Man(3)GlcNAc(2)-PP-Dol alpha-1,2-mannosyltransferase [Fimicolochytrium jonesii]|uniref:GDP-Man:Man(3)GlcNAc(2)-PP-Dol alpha-1,2-mannosyltransferase n=1 Tax=Fimicolochytrium jonesii TaxID=1396493 RepID=UPI0022FEBB98|nr:GDP-Man:Man(3)GlcNAc(2)-PP-Dol alpha-1,2-mannosyltransferase [Fimicolochytrium jonesii]KAI8816796.1 GDP-Man:Man(3)GlcNAc(2)-PP-Dol alpha-1,2-mannosyltransferase [Fimicolochytrium jonesii]
MSAFLAVFTAVLAVLAALILGTLHKSSRRRRSFPTKRNPVLGFFHPYCDAGGGGERVLWSAIRAIQTHHPRTTCVIYTWSKAGPPSQILAKVRSQFGVKVDEGRVEFVRLETWGWLAADRYRFMTLLLQSLGSLITAWEALRLYTPDVFVDTVGFAFTYPLAKHVFGCKVVTYVHYPTISSDMLGRVAARKAGYNNSGAVARSSALTGAKIWYYRLVAYLYGHAGRAADVVMVNSTWTLNHITTLWRIPTRTSIVYPPCDTAALKSFSLDDREEVIVAVAQFRPEKDHTLQLDAFARLLDKYPEHRDRLKLVMIGGSRNAEDRGRVAVLGERARELNIAEQVQIIENGSYTILLSHLRKASLGLHTMRDEHFGIGIVEYMAAGVIPVAHNSGGPKLDIVTEVDGEPTGFLAETAEEYADALHRALKLSGDAQRAMRNRARASVVDRFSEEVFARGFVEALGPLLAGGGDKRED